MTTDLNQVPRRIRAALELLESTQVIDVHHHLGSWQPFARVARVRNQTESNSPIQQRLEFMDDVGISQALLHPDPRTRDERSTCAQLSQNAADVASSCSERIPGALATVALTSPTIVDDMTSHVMTCCGFTFHHRFIGHVLDHPAMDDVADAAGAFDLPVAVHCVAESTLAALWRLLSLARRFPKTQFVALVAFSSPSQGQQVYDIADLVPNVTFETSAICSVGSLLTEFVNRHGSHRLMFGSDLYVEPSPIYCLPTNLFEILALPISLADKEWILSGNAKRVFAKANWSEDQEVTL